MELFKEGLSPYEIAEKIPGYNHMKVRRLLKKMGVKPRSKSEAQSNALKNGRAKLPKVKSDANGVYNSVEEENINE